MFPFLRTAQGAVAMGTVWWMFASRGIREALSDRWWVATTASFTIGALTAGKEGSGGNYLLETMACAAVLLATHLPEMLAPRAHLRPWVVTGLAVGLMLNVGLGLPRTLPGPRLDRIAVVTRLVGETPPGTPILADGHLVPDVLAAGRRPVLNDSWFLRLLVQRRPELQRQLASDLEGGRIPLVLFARSLADQRQFVGTTVQYWPAEVLDILQRDYVEDTSLGEIVVLRFAREHAKAN